MNLRQFFLLSKKAFLFGKTQLVLYRHFSIVQFQGMYNIYLTNTSFIDFKMIMQVYTT